MTLSSKNNIGKKVEEILIDMRAKGNPIFAGLSVQDISLLASECIVEDVFVQNHYSKFRNCSLLMSTRQLYKVNAQSLFEDLIEDNNVSDSELNDCLRLGVVVLWHALKSFPHFTTLPYEKRRMVSVYFLIILLNGDFKEIGFNYIDKSNYLGEYGNVENLIDIGSTNWATKNHAGPRNGIGESLIVVKDSNSWAEAAERGLPACCSYAFLSEFDKVLGLYYNWYAIEEMTKNPPEGWRVPTMGDFELLLETVNNDGLSLKREDQFQNGENGTNASGFSALVGGYVYSDSGEFDNFGKYGGLWSSTTSDSENTRAYCLFMGPYDNGGNLAIQDKGLGFNLRLIKNTTINSSLKSNSTIYSPVTNLQNGNPVGSGMFCPKCQINLEPNAKFCTDCGTSAVKGVSTKEFQKTTIWNGDSKVISTTSEDYKKGENKISNPKPYFYMLYGGLVIFTLFGLIALITKNSDIFIVGAIGLWAILLAQIYIYVFIYQFWRFVIDEGKKVGLSFEVETPGKAVGYLFIPFYNIFVWTFKVFREFPLAFNRVAEAKGYKVRMPLSPASNIPVWILVGIIPFVNIITSIALIFFANPGFIEQGVSSINQSKKAEAVR